MATPSWWRVASTKPVKYYELFAKSPLAEKSAIVTSYAPSAADLKGEESGEGDTENIEKYKIYRQMLAEWFREHPDKAIKRVEEFDKAVKKKFVDEPGQMKLLIVVDKLLTGFDAPSATYLYIDKHMQDHGLFQAICRVNRLDGEDKEYGYIIDYKDLFEEFSKPPSTTTLREPSMVTRSLMLPVCSKIELKRPVKDLSKH